jgi:Flp pilus assembly protein TadB
MVPTQVLMIHTASHPGRRSRRDARDAQRRAVVQGRGARGRWWYRLRGIVGLFLITVAAAILTAGAVVSLVALAAYLVRSFSG